MRWQTYVAVALALGFAVGGYALTGKPGVPAAPAPALSINPDLTPDAETASKTLLENFGDVRAWLTLSDALIRVGKTETAVEALESALDAIPGNADLWVQMGVALVAHAQGEVVPAARLAFDRASRLEPSNPAPAYFVGLAWLQQGDTGQALGVWRQLLARSKPEDPWVPMLNRQIAAAEMMAQMGVGAGQGVMPPMADRPDQAD